MLADEIVVVSDGEVLQSGICRDVYQRPASAAVGRLLGIDNLFEGSAGSAGVPGGLALDLPAGARLLWHVPPEALRVRPSSSAGNGARVDGAGSHGAAVDLGPGLVTDIIDLGRAVEVVVSLTSGTELRSRTLDLPDLTVGAACRVETDAAAVSAWPEPTPLTSPVRTVNIATSTTHTNRGG